MASSKEIQRILSSFQTSFFESPEKFSSPFFSTSSVDDIISSIRQHALLSQSSPSSSASLQEWIKTVNASLRSSSDRLLGLRLLKETLRQCSTDVFKLHRSFWFRQLNSIAFAEGVSASSEDARLAAFDCLVDVIATSTSLPDCAREMTAKDNVPQTVVSLLNLDRGMLIRGGLPCLVECVRSFSAAVGSVGKGKLEKKSLEILQDSRLEGNGVVDGVLEDAAVFFSLLPKVGGAGVGGSRYREAWESQFALLVDTLNSVVDDLFRDVSRVGARFLLDAVNVSNDNGLKPSRLPLEPLRGDDVARYFSLLRRFRMLMRCLSAMLRTEIGVSVRIPLTSVLTLIFRVGNLTPSSLTFKPTNEGLTLAAILPELYSISLRVMSDLLMTAGSRLLNHGLSINRLMLQMLNATALKDDEGRIYGLAACYQECRSRIYEFFTSWLFVYPSLKTGTKGESSHKLVVHVLRDARPPETEKAILTGKSDVSSDSKRGGGSAKAKRKMKGSFFESASVTSDRKVDALANAEVVSAALKTASTLILTQGRALPPEIHKTLVEFCVPLLQSICLRTTTNHSLPIPYSSSECRSSLFSLLKSLALNPSPKWPPPIAAASAIFRQGIGHRDATVRSICVEANVIVANLIHPRVHPIQMPIVFPKELEESTGKKRKLEGEERERNVDRPEPDFTKDSTVDGNVGGESTPAPEFAAAAAAQSIEMVDVVEDENMMREETEERELNGAETTAEEEKERRSDVADFSSHSPIEESRVVENRSPLESPMEKDDDEAPSPGHARFDDVIAAGPSGIRQPTSKDSADVPTPNEDEDLELEAMLRDFNPDTDPDPI